MIDKKTDFSKIINNFEKTEKIPSIQIIKSKLDFVPKVTIAIPTFKRVDLLKEAIDSAINQKFYSNYDIIVVDNDPQRGCETEKLLTTYTDNRISYYKNSENIGMSGNWNRLFELAQGEYVVMLHDDDLIVTSFLSACMQLVDDKPNLGILKPMMHFFSDSLSLAEIENCELNAKEKVGFGLGYLKRIYDIDNYSGFILGAPTGCLFKKKNVFTTGGFNQDFYPSLDYCFAFLISKHFETYILKQKLVLYRIGVNETLKISVLTGHVTDGFFLRRAILKSTYLPDYFINKYLTYYTLNLIKSCKKLNVNFEFDLNILNLKSENRKKLFLVSLFVQNYIRIVKLVKYKIV
ncbi:glycosyltransferase family 2 protein [Flavobacterium aquidurense]|uniref:glycosyltransferase family 2 protein n=1 Tax=Flavobacterium aquidurense TaxID=362413 RepID=UPI0037220D6C